MGEVGRSVNGYGVGFGVGLDDLWETLWKTYGLVGFCWVFGTWKSGVDI